MEAFYRTDIEVPAELIVDGEVYPEVGVHFRGTSSYFTVSSAKKSFNIAVDYGEDGQRLYGYKTLNLLTGMSMALSSVKCFTIESPATTSPR